MRRGFGSIPFLIFLPNPSFLSPCLSVQSYKALSLNGGLILPLRSSTDSNSLSSALDGIITMPFATISEVTE